MTQTLKETLPYFLGAVPLDQAAKRSQLRAANRELQRATAALTAAERSAAAVETELRAVYAQAASVGLLDPTQPATRNDTITALRRVAERAVPARSQSDGTPEDTERERLLAAQTEARRRIETLSSERAVLLEQRSAETDYLDALNTQAGRLLSLNLLNPQADTPTRPCPRPAA